MPIVAAAGAETLQLMRPDSILILPPTHLGSRRYDVSVVIEAESAHFYGGERECLMRERFARYDVDGVGGGRGVCEWQYRNTDADAGDGRRKGRWRKN